MKETSAEEEGNLRLWDEEVAIAVKENHHTYSLYLHTLRDERWKAHRVLKNGAKILTRKCHNELWDAFVSSIETDILTKQNGACKRLKHMNS